MEEKEESYEHAEQNTHQKSVEQNTHPFVTAELFLFESVECNKNVELKLSLPPVQVSSSLELHLVIIGGGTVCRRLLYMLLASVNDKRDGFSSNGLKVQHGSTLLFHPSRITVITRQPERLSVFAALGVRCVKGTHHYLTSSDVAECDVLCLACQPEHLPSVVKTHFTPPCYNDNNNADVNNTNGHRVMREDSKERVEGERTKWDVNNSNLFEAHKASSNKTITVNKATSNNFLKQTCVVFSCLAGVSSRKLSTLLHHPQRLILCASLNTLPHSCELQQEQWVNKPQQSSLSSHSSLPLSSEHTKHNNNKNLEKLCAPSQKGTCLPALAQLYANEVDSCRALRVQYMADHDSFLHDAVCEAEQIQIHKAAEEIIHNEANTNVDNISSSSINSRAEESRLNINNKTQKEFTSLLPEQLRYRTAFTSATQATLHSHTAPSIHSFLQTNTVASLEFVCRAWNVVQSYTDLLLEHIMLSEQTSSSSSSSSAAATISVANKVKHKKIDAHKRSSTRITAQTTSAVRSNNKHNTTKTSDMWNSEQEMCEKHEIERRESSTSEISFLCMALAALPPDTHMMLITALRRRYLLEALSEFDDDSYLLNYSNLFPQIAFIQKATKQNMIEHVCDKSNVTFQSPPKQGQIEHNTNNILTQGYDVNSKVKDRVGECKLDDYKDNDDDSDDNNQVDRGDAICDISVTAATTKGKEQYNSSSQTKTKQMHRTVCAYLAILMNCHFPFAFASDEQVYNKLHSQYRTILHTVNE